LYNKILEKYTIPNSNFRHGKNFALKKPTLQICVIAYVVGNGSFGIDGKFERANFDE